MDKINKNPEIRFKGFTEDWCVKTAEFLCSISTGKNNTQDKIEGGKYPFYVRSLTIERSNNYLFDEEAVLTVGDGVGTGKVYHYVNGKYDLHQRVYRMFDFKELSGKYFYYFFSNNFHKRVTAMTAKSSVDSVRMEMISNMDIIYPRLVDEQNLITSFFQNLDNLITLHQKKYDKLVILKKAMLVKMFPKKGTLVPEIRFKGFSGDWVEKELNEIANRFDNLRIPITANKRIKGQTPYYGANGIQGYVQGHTHEGEFILVAEDGANDLKNYPVQYVKGKIWVNNHAHVLQTKKNIADNKFLNRTISNTNVEPFLVGGGRAKLNAEIMMKIVVKIPSSIKEQQQIGSYFEYLDNQIKLHKTQLEKLNNIKKACFSKMFVGQD